MYKNKKILAIIPARGGSKGIKNKNIVKVNGIPLIGYTINAAKKSKYIDKIIVSTDSLKIKKVVEKLDINVPFLRPENISGDSSKSVDAIINVIENLKIKGDTYDYIVFLQPTSPLRKTSNIDEAIEMLIDSNYNSLVSISKTIENPILFRTFDNKYALKPLLNSRSDIRRQEFKDYYKVNGAIYINKWDQINNSTSLNDNEVGYVMDQSDSIDIDTHEDLTRFRKIILTQKNPKL